MATNKASRRAGQGKLAVGSTEALLTMAEACQLLHVHANTLRRWSQIGLLRARRLGPRGDRRFRREDVEALLLAQPE
jgi:excisionase family DNA binding protein